MFCVLAAVLGGSLSLISCASGKKDELSDVIEEATRMLEAREYEEFLRRFISPEDKTKILQNTTLEKMAVEFGDEKANRLLRTLKKAKGRQPEYVSETSEATFRFDSDVGADTQGLRPLTFKKVNGAWYIKN